MRSVFLASVVLASGCFADPAPPPPPPSGYQTGTFYMPSPGHPLPPDPFGVPANTPDYLIDSGVLVDPSLGPYRIYVDANFTWTLFFLGDNVPRHFSGDLYCPEGCDLSAQFTNAMPNDSINTIANNHVGFDAYSDGSVLDPSVEPYLTISTFGPPNQPLQPITFDLRFDDQPAVNPLVLFSSGGQLATTDIMPFNLISSTYAGFGRKPGLAPQFVLPKGNAEKTFSRPEPSPPAVEARTEVQTVAK